MKLSISTTAQENCLYGKNNKYSLQSVHLQRYWLHDFLRIANRLFIWPFKSNLWKKLSMICLIKQLFIFYDKMNISWSKRLSSKLFYRLEYSIYSSFIFQSNLIWSIIGSITITLMKKNLRKTRNLIIVYDIMRQILQL